ncbi:L,D-peptidoglycan transpeptidase YkuD (ErfK/YbiS/YcfS/YnhG family) [Kitasatospora sp. GP30]|uniref:L,D-transpeptidase family protein n=1 Tax=Kitasatospora sp. GP30 TaxID=3035084 RepID=UPI000CA9F180|nr:L,D-transpeptidase family protein [Kitasatospora sp. GP30]MDH6144923.1 L,D-peptidoglycan transpeptidase YkuD (ErfK/YbiS/YcfS/YnhG family) [Kitasatospora sp. GP30]
MKDFARFAGAAARPPRDLMRRHGRALLCAVGLLAGATASCATPAFPPTPPAHPTLSGAPAADVPPLEPLPAPPAIAGLGPGTLALLPPDARQVLVAAGSGADSSDTAVQLWTADDDGHWTAGPAWRAHNARQGWTAEHRSGDLHSPIGVFSLSDAGGQLPDPGTRLPYYRSNAFAVGGTGFEGEPLTGAFDYVVAIDYNRVPGRSPLDESQPLGDYRGGGIWLHVDHGGPTHGCVTLAKDDMRTLLTMLDPAAHPVIVMGPADRLRQ